jgi:predicted MPP superfamily phosphohydrolase
VKIFHISDTHGRFWQTPKEADLVIHTGDFFPDFHVKPHPHGGWLIDRQKAAHAQDVWILSNRDKLERSIEGRPMIFLAGNHDWATGIPGAICVSEATDFKQWDLHFVCLPHIPWIRGQWARELGRADAHKACHAVFDLVTRDTILLTHAPALGTLDACPNPVGCRSIDTLVAIAQPQVHLHGHIHEGNGEARNGRTYVSNAACKGRMIDV